MDELATVATGGLSTPVVMGWQPLRDTQDQDAREVLDAFVEHGRVPTHRLVIGLDGIAHVVPVDGGRSTP